MDTNKEREAIDWMWCYENPKEAAAEIDRLQTALAREQFAAYEAEKISDAAALAQPALIEPLSAGGQESEVQVVARIEQTASGQITIKNGDGDYFDMSKYVGTSLYLAPPSAHAIEAAALRKAAEVCEGRRDSLALSAMVSASNEAGKCAALIHALIPKDGIEKD